MALLSKARLETALLNWGCVIHSPFVKRCSTGHWEGTHE